MQSRTRAAMHAGSWYVAERAKLDDELNQYLSKAKQELKVKQVKGIIGPHAGYYYSGPTAAWAYRYLAKPETILRVFLLGPSHHIYLQGCGLTGMDYWDTPLGKIQIDVESTLSVYAASQKLRAAGKFRIIDQDDQQEQHSLEMHLPYLKKMLGDQMRLIPIMVGATDAKMEQDYAKLLQPYFQQPDTLFIISSDFCHWGSRFQFSYHNKDDGEVWQSIEKLDGQGMNLIQNHDAAGFDKYIKDTENTICGRHPIGIYLNILKLSKLPIKTKFVKYAQSEQVKKKSGSSVSYASAVSYLE